MTPPLLSDQLRRPLSWSLMILWGMCCVFIGVVVILGMTLMQRVDTLAEQLGRIGQEQNKHTGVIAEIQFLRDEIGRLRAIQTGQVVVIEQNKQQVQANLLDIARLQKQVDGFLVQLQELRYGPRTNRETGQPAPSPDAPQAP